MGEEIDSASKKKRRRRRRRRRRGPGSETATATPQNWQPEGDAGEAPKKKGRRQAIDFSGPQITLPATGRNPYRKRASRAKRGTPGSAAARKRRLTRPELDEANRWLERMPEHLLETLYKGLGGQPKRVANAERMIQLTMRALNQSSRIGNVLRSLHERDRKAVAAMLQAGSITHADELLRELSLSYGGHEREWTRTMNVLAEKGIVFATSEQEGQFFYVIPEVIVDALVHELTMELTLPTFAHDDVRVVDQRPFCPPLDFSVTSLATYIDQRMPRLTQRQEIYRHDQEEMDQFFSQLWSANSELFKFHLDFLMIHGMVELRGEYLSLNRDVMEEWLQLEAEDQRDLIFRALERRFPMGEWILWAIHAATAQSESDSAWVAERPLVDLYRRWKRGEDWRDRYERRSFSNLRTSERESFSFAPLVHCGLLEMGQWGQEKFYRLSPRGVHLLNPPEDDGFRQFYLTPSFEIMAPAGIAPILLFRIGELAELTGCDRANTYRITDQVIERAIEKGWRRDDVLQFLRDNSQIGLPENVEQTLKGWIGNRGDVEFHEVTILTVHRSQVRRLESNKRLKSYLLHRFAPGMYAVDAHRKAELIAALEESNFAPSRETRGYPGAPEQVEARQNLHKLLAEARDSIKEPARRGAALIAPEDLQPVPGTKVAKRQKKPDLPPIVEPGEIRALLDKAMSNENDVEMVYRAKNGQKLALRVQPQRLAFKAESPVLVGLDTAEGERRTFVLDRIERLRIT